MNYLLNSVNLVKYYFLFQIFTILVTVNLIGQGENNIWFMTDFVIDFNGNTPEIRIIPFNHEIRDLNTNSPSTISDKNGNLLFFSSGRALFDKSYWTTRNGTFLLGGNQGQPTIFVPFPNDSNFIYLFTIGVANGYPNFEMELRYNIIDIRLNQGMGDIVQGQKNIFVTENVTGMMATARGKCGAIWLIVHEFESNRFLAYKIGDKGIEEPVISEVGATYKGNNTINPFRYSKLRVSPDNKRLAYFSNVLKKIELFEFDNEKGVVFNSVSLPIENQTNNTPSGAFSSNSTVLYTFEKNTTQDRFYQFDLSSNDSNKIVNSKTLVGRNLVNIGSHGVDMQLAPNGVVLMGGINRAISAIPFPNNIGLSCGFVDTFLFSNTCCFENSFQNLVVTPSLPTQIDSLLLPIDQQLCAQTQLNINITAQGDTYQWQDGNTNPNYEITAPGTYWVKVEKGNCTYTDTLEIFPDESIINIGEDTTICQNESLQLQIIPTQDIDYQWNNGSKNTTFTVNEAGIYWVEATDSLCSSRDSLTVIIESIPIDLPADTFLCEGQEILLRANVAGIDLLWQNGSTANAQLITEAGIYWLEAKKRNCVVRDTVNVSQKTNESILPNDTVLCNIDKYTIKTIQSYDTVVWWESATLSDTLQITESGIYHALADSQECPFWDSIKVTFHQVEVALPNDTTFCEESLYLLNIGTKQGNITWQDGSTDSQFLVEKSGEYWVKLAQENCEDSDTIHIVYESLQLDLGADTSLCEGETIDLDIAIPNANYLWQDNSSSPNISISQSGLYWAEVSKENCTVSDSILIKISPKPIFNLGSDTTICEGETLLISAPIDGEYEWQDGSKGIAINIDESGNYSLLITSENCSYKDSIEIAYTICDEETLCGVYIPNIFSPNGDGINDEYQVFSSCELADYSMEVYDRWGNRLFSTTDVLQSWDGSVLDENLEGGVYLVKVIYRLLGEAREEVVVEALTIIR